MDLDRKKELLGYLVEGLCAERGHAAPPAENVGELWKTFRALVNTRPPMPAGSSWLEAQDELLAGLIDEAGIASVKDGAPCTYDDRIRLWQGDITTLAVDAIVNAANSQMLGCWVPGHYCIDNAIHTFAGVQLRLECACIMDAQGCEEPTGCAKITAAYNLLPGMLSTRLGPLRMADPRNCIGLSWPAVTAVAWSLPRKTTFLRSRSVALARACLAFRSGKRRKSQ